MIGQLNISKKAINDTSIGMEFAATEGFDINETPRHTAGRCTGCAGVERIIDLCVDCYVNARG